jgi:hypothetical protein
MRKTPFELVIFMKPEINSEKLDVASGRIDLDVGENTAAPCGGWSG